MLSMVSVLFLYSLSVVLSLVSASAHLSSLEVCHQIRDSRIKILAMGSRGYRDEPDKHWVYLLAEGGYLFVVPFTNLTLNLTQAAENKLTLGGDYKDASRMFSEKAEIFTVKGPEAIRYQKFSFITNDDGQHFLMRMYSLVSRSEHDCYELYPLDGGVKKEHECYEDKRIRNRANFLLSMDSTKKTNGHADQWTLIEVWRYEVREEVMRYVYVIKAKDDIVNVIPYLDSQFGRLSPIQSNIVTAFALVPDDSVTLVLVSDTGKVTIGQRKHLYTKEIGFENSVEQPLSDFVQCVMSDKVAPIQTIPPMFNQPSTTVAVGDSGNSQLWIYVLVAILIFFICGLTIYCYKKRNRGGPRYEQQKMKWLSQTQKTQTNNTSNDLESSNPSQVDKSSGVKQTITTKASSTVNSPAQKSGILSTITNKIKSMVAQSAKSTNKAKKDKAKKKKKKVNKPKVDKEPTKSSIDGQERGSSTS